MFQPIHTLHVTGIKPHGFIIFIVFVLMICSTSCSGHKLQHKLTLILVLDCAFISVRSRLMLWMFLFYISSIFYVINLVCLCVCIFFVVFLLYSFFVYTWPRGWFKQTLRCTFLSARSRLLYWLLQFACLINFLCC